MRVRDDGRTLRTDCLASQNRGSEIQAIALALRDQSNRREMEEPVESPRSRRSLDDALFRCSAALRDRNELQPRAARAAISFGVMVVLAYAWLEYARRPGLDSDGTPCCCLVSLLISIGPLSLFSRFFANRGLLILFEDQLVFRHRGSTSRSIEIDLSQILRIGRRRNRIHISLKTVRDDVVYKSARSQLYFVCSRLRGEDMYDRLLSQLDDRDAGIVSHERKN